MSSENVIDREQMREARRREFHTMEQIAREHPGSSHDAIDNLERRVRATVEVDPLGQLRYKTANPNVIAGYITALSTQLMDLIRASCYGPSTRSYNAELVNWATVWSEKSNEHLVKAIDCFDAGMDSYREAKEQGALHNLPGQLTQTSHMLAALAGNIYACARLVVAATDLLETTEERKQEVVDRVMDRMRTVMKMRTEIAACLREASDEAMQIATSFARDEAALEAM